MSNDERGPGPYRDDREALRAEIDRLRSTLDHERGKRTRLASLVVALVAFIVLRHLLSGWLNGADDAKFWVAFVVAHAPLAWVAIGGLKALLQPRRDVS